MIELQKLLETVIEKKASDLHITTGSPPQFRIDGKLMSVDNTLLTAPETKRLCYSVLTDAQRHKFEEDWELDFSFGIKGLKYNDFQSSLKSKYVPIKTDNAVSLFIQAIIYMLNINGKSFSGIPTPVSSIIIFI